MGCGGCIVPDKKGGQIGGSGGGQPPFKGVDEIDIRLGTSPKAPGSPITPGGVGGKPAYNLKPPGGSVQQTFSGDVGVPNPPGGSGKQSLATPITPGGSGPGYGTQGNQSPSKYPEYKTPGGIPFPQSPQTSGGVQESGGGGINQPQSAGGSPPKPAFAGPPPSQGLPGESKGQGLGAPALPGTPGTSPQPGSPQYKDGLPPGMTMDDLMALLYKFNYTLKYHGHHESGYRNGDKEGGYFFNGRDGLGRDVKYLANEFGFQPNITLVSLGLQSPNTPKEENEEPNELLGNEFKWFYNR